MSAAHAGAALAAPAGRAPWTADRLLLWTCVGIPMAGLALFFLYPLATVAWNSLVEKTAPSAWATTPKSSPRAAS